MVSGGVYMEEQYWGVYSLWVLVQSYRKCGKEFIEIFQQLSVDTGWNYT